MKLRRDRFPTSRAKSYDEVRDQIQSGDLLLCSGTAAFSKLIQKATGSVWSHVAFVIRLETIQRVMVLESVESIGVRTVPLSQYVRNYGATKKGYPGKLLIARHANMASVAESRLNRMSQFAVDLFGYPYDQSEIARIAARIAAAKLGFKKGEFKRDEEYICSEYAWECYHRLGIDVEHDHPAFVAPADFAGNPQVDGLAVLKVEK